MRIRNELAYPATPIAVARMIHDREFVLGRCEAMQSLDIEVTVTGEVEGAFTVTTSRVQATDQVPEALRRFAGRGVTIRQTDTWQAPTSAGARIGSVAVEIAGLPISFDGTMALEPTPDGCIQSVEGNLTASIPLIGGRVEQAAAPAIEGAMRAEQRCGLAWLASLP